MNKADESKQILRLAADMSRDYYKKPLIITYSGGKDSDVMLRLALECLNPADFEVHNSHTTVDAPPTVYHIRHTFEHLQRYGIKTVIHYPIPPHLSQAYEYLSFHKGDFPVTELYANEVLSLPLYNGMTKDEIREVIEIMLED